MYTILIKKRNFIKQKYHWVLKRNGKVLASSEKQYNLKDVEEVTGHLAKKLNCVVEYAFDV